MKAVFMTITDYEAYLETGAPLYYDSPQQLFEYEGDVPFEEVTICEINLN
jgi:hypothetical protein